MSEHYHDVGDIRFQKEMRNLAPAEFNARLGLEKIVGRKDGAIAMVGREDGVSAMVSFAKGAMKAIAGGAT